MPKNFNNLQNLIIYGPSGIGKYTQSLNIIKNFSESELKYEKKISVIHNKEEYYLKISDIHYEINISHLGCNAKILWNDIYQQIVDIISTKKVKNGIILCKNFHNIHNELLEIFYSYVQKQFNRHINIKFIFITENISFIPDNIISSCKIISLARPSKTIYKKCLKPNVISNVKNNLITNIKSLKYETNEYFEKQDIYEKITEKVLEFIFEDNKKYTYLRDVLYEIFINNLEVEHCIYKIINATFDKKKVSSEIAHDIFIQTFNFLKLYNNNYRPIYHLESFIFFIIYKINENK